jgi:hypothetical protein
MAKSRISQCPPGYLCLSDGVFIFIVLCIAIGTGVLLFMRASPSAPNLNVSQNQPRPTIIDNRRIIGDLRYTPAPQPLRDWMAPPEFPPRGGIASIPINIPTQGLPESFQMVGNINIGDGQMLPLYGRRTLSSSDRWNYYTRTDSFNPVPLSIRYQQRDCMDQVGCQELLGGEEIKVEGTGKRGRVRMYKFDGPKYIPGFL